ncbi:MAG TPA: DUF4012 domain-containing protein [Candidatus Woesebacteria bacterium]|nr:DUF4012 domain-containing protein [Candidatus Woesebacteria bacterium]
MTSTQPHQPENNTASQDVIQLIPSMDSLQYGSFQSRSRMRRSQKKTLLARFGLATLAVFLAIVAGLYLFVGVPLQKVQKRADVLKAKAQEMRMVLTENDIDLLATKTAELRVEFDGLQSDSKALAGLQFIPHVRDYFAALEAGDSLLAAGSKAIEAIAPIADLLGLKKDAEGDAKTNLYTLTTEERLATAMLTLDGLMQEIDPIAADIAKAKETIDTIDPNRYPTRIGSTEVRAQIQNAKDQFDGAYRLVVNAQPFLKQLPTILGNEKKMRYLIIFQNDKERRATGGFWTGTTELTLEKGKFEFAGVTNIYDIDAGIRPAKAPDPITRYFKGVDVWHLRDTNISPDLVESVKNFQSLYKTYGAAVEYDGIFFIDTTVLVDLINIFGEEVKKDNEVIGYARYVEGIKFSTETDPRCECPQVIYTLLESIGTQVGYARGDRKAILGSLLKDLMNFAIGASPSKYWGRVTQTMLQNMDEKHVLLYFIDPTSQAAVEKMGWAGRLEVQEGIDYLHINNVNFGGQKSNLFVEESVQSATQGSKRTVTITFKNPFASSNCNLEQEQVLCLNAPLRNWIRFYVPKGSELIELKGSTTPVRTYDELDFTVFEGFMIVNPEGRAEVTAEYTLPTGVDSAKIFIQKQAGLEEQEWNVSIEGASKFVGILSKDTLVK